MNAQKEIVWFPQDRPDLAPSKEDRTWWCDPTNEMNPFSKFIGNAKAVRRLNRSAFSAFGNYNRCLANQSFALLGPASSGKTTIVKMLAELVGIPFIEISPRSIKNIYDLIAQVAKVLEETIVPFEDGQTTLELQDLGSNEFCFPPMIIFIDEAHALRPSIVQGLLKATEKNDSILVDEHGRSYDCSNVCWCIATTDRGLLFDAFDTRFSKIYLNLYSLDEVAQIIHLNSPDWDMDICQLVAKFGGRVPREALAFANEIRVEEDMTGDDWEDVVKRVAEENGIDPYGMSYQRLNVLEALSKHNSISKSNLATVIGCKEEELVKYIMPPLQAETSDQKALVKITTRGYAITNAGRDQLALRASKRIAG